MVRVARQWPLDIHATSKLWQVQETLSIYEQSYERKCGRERWTYGKKVMTNTVPIEWSISMHSRSASSELGKQCFPKKESCAVEIDRTICPSIGNSDLLEKQGVAYNSDRSMGMKRRMEWKEPVLKLTSVQVAEHSHHSTLGEVSVLKTGEKVEGCYRRCIDSSVNRTTISYSHYL